MKFWIILAMIFGFSFNAIAQSVQDSLEVKGVVIAFQDDFNDGKFINAEKYTTSDWEHINPGGGIDKGRAKVLEVVRGVHQDFLKGVTMRLDDISIRFITPDVAIVDAIHSIDTYTAPDGKRHENERNIKTYIVTKKSGKWLLTHDHNTIIQ